MADEETPSEGLTGAFWERVKEFYNKMWENFWKQPTLVLEEWWTALPTAIWSKSKKEAAEYVQPELKKLLDSVGAPAEINNRIKALYETSETTGTITGLIVLIFYVMGEITNLQGVTSESARQEFYNAYRNILPDVATLILALYRNPELSGTVKDLLHKQGYSDTRIDILLKGTKSVLAPDELKNLFLRGEITDATLKTGLKKYGFNDAEINHLKTLFYPIPGYPDLVRMAVREAFYPDYIEEYGLMQELPGEFLEYSKKQGLSEEWAKRFWASHWELPSILQGFEMLHRDVITTEQLDSLFMATDIMPWWRDKLEKISYNPLTRVDVRRVFKMGIIDRDQVKRTYLDLGYDDEKAEWLTRFTEMQNTETDRDLTKAEILSSYIKNIIGRSDCNGMLLDLGYSQDEVNILISMQEYKWIKEEKDRELKRIKKYYLAGAYTANQAINELGKLDLVGSEQDSIMKLWDSDKLAKLKLPSKADLGKLLKANVINENTYKVEMKHLGYTDRYIGWFLSLALMAPEEE